jgi:hypothetical protein
MQRLASKDKPHGQASREQDQQQSKQNHEGTSKFAASVYAGGSTLALDQALCPFHDVAIGPEGA